MAGPVDLDQLKRQLAQRIDALAPQLFPLARRDGRYWRVGSIGGEKGESLAINRSGPHQGCWYDFAAGEGGSALDLVAQRVTNGDISAAVNWALDWCGLGHVSPVEQARLAASDRGAQAAADAADLAARASRQRQAQAIWLGARPFEGTPGEDYLLGRAIDCRALGRFPRALRYSDRVYHSQEWGERPALLAYVLDPLAGRQIAVHRHYLRRLEGGGWTGDRRLGKSRKKALGSYSGGHIPLWRGRHEGPLRDLPQGSWIATAEGIENALSLAMAEPTERIIAHVALNNLSALRLPDNIAGLYVVADNDAEGSAAAAGLARQIEGLNARGIRTEILRAPPPHKDFNDWLMALRAAEAGGRASA